MKEFYTPRDLARELGQSEDTAKRVLRARDPEHVGWWRLSPEDFACVLAEVRLPARRFGGVRRRQNRA